MFFKKYEELRVTESSQIGDKYDYVVSRAHPSTRPIALKALNLAISWF